MGYRLYREVLDHAPADLSWAELAVWLVLADDANDDTRTGWLDPEALHRRTRHGKTTVADVLYRLARRGYDLRVVRGTDKNGRPVYAYKGARTTYRMPVLKGPDSPEALPAKGSGLDVQRVRTTRVKGPDSPEPFPSGSPQVPSAASRAAQIVADKTDATDTEAAAVVAAITTERQPRNVTGLVARMAADGDLAEWLAQVRANGHRADAAERLRNGWPCPRCRTRNYVDADRCRQCGAGQNPDDWWNN